MCLEYRTPRKSQDGNPGSVCDLSSCPVVGWSTTNLTLLVTSPRTERASFARDLHIFLSAIHARHRGSLSKVRKTAARTWYDGQTGWERRERSGRALGAAT